MHSRHYPCSSSRGFSVPHGQRFVRPTVTKASPVRNKPTTSSSFPMRSQYGSSLSKQSEQKDCLPSVSIMYLLRGAPGSGKSTLAKQLCKERGVILSTDDYFFTSEGYEFDPTLLGEAHEWNKQRAFECLKRGQTPVVIDNTNMVSWEMRPYMVMAVKHGYRIEILEPNTWWKFKPNELARRNNHGVPKETIRKMLSKYEKDVSVESVLGRDLFMQYQRECLKQIPPGQSSSYRTSSSYKDTPNYASESRSAFETTGRRYRAPRYDNNPFDDRFSRLKLN